MTKQIIVALVVVVAMLAAAGSLLVIKHRSDQNKARNDIINSVTTPQPDSPEGRVPVHDSPLPPTPPNSN